MAKASPEERWRKHVLERFVALKQSKELIALRKKGLTILGRKKLFSAKEWGESFTKRTSSKEYLNWHSKCEALGKRFGLAPWVVARACLQKEYKPEEEPYVMEATWPVVRLVTDATDPEFLLRLSYEAQKVGLNVVQQRDSDEVTLVYGYPVPPPDDSSTSPFPVSKPPSNIEFWLRIETPIGYPPEAARRLQKRANNATRALLRRLGYPIPERLRNSPLVSNAKVYKLKQKKLPTGGIYHIMEKTAPESSQDSLDNDQKRRQLIKSRRHRLSKRLKEQYE